jgi:adenylate kinase family enzyme
MAPVEEFVANVHAALASCSGGWVIDGNYHTVRDPILAQADTVIWLRFPWRTSFWRVFKRTVTRAWRKDLLWGTNQESWRLSFLDKNSLLLWSISHHRASIRSIALSLAEVPHAAEVFVVRSSNDVEEVVARLVEARAKLAEPSASAH